MNKMMSQDELQHIEHANKILLEHQELVKAVVNETESLLNNYLPILVTYVRNIGEAQNNFGKIVSNILSSTRELNLVTKNTQPLIDFMSQVDRLNKILTPELIEKLQKVIK